jgi:cytoskeletal protein CcmA (bactofilin family)
MHLRMRVWIIGLLTLLLAPGWALVMRQGDTVTIAAGETIADDVLVAGGTVRVEGAIDGDLVVAGGTVTVNGAVQRNLIVAGGTVIVHGPVAGTVYAAGGTLDLNSTIGRNLVMAGGNITAGADTRVARDAVLNGGQLVLAGTVVRNVLVSAGSLTVEKTARIGGNLTGQAPSPKIDPGATIGGTTNLSEPVSKQDGKKGLAGLFIWRLLSAIGLLILGLVTVAAVPRFTREAITMIAEHPWATLLAGLIVLLLTPLVMLILLIVPPLSLLLFLLYLVALLVAPVFAVVRIGAWVWRRTGSLYPMLLIGVGIYFLVRLIPILGDLVGLLALLYGLGTLALTLQARTARPLFHRPEPPGPVAMDENLGGEDRA